MIKGARVGALLFSLEHHLPIYCIKKPESILSGKKKKKKVIFINISGTEGLSMGVLWMRPLLKSG